MPPHTFLFAHLQLVASMMGELPPHIHGVYIADKIRQRYPEMDSAFYLDIWPVGRPFFMLIKPELVYQLTQANQLPKDPGLTRFLTPLAGSQNLVTMEGHVWGVEDPSSTRIQRQPYLILGPGYGGEG
jgi:hypothetical protein